jgi:ABC-type nitrate/sulfonate/bicarbonate transport system substrate-binding protein
VTTASPGSVRLRVSTFAGAAALPIHVAHDRGYFARCGLDVELVETRSSNELMRGLVDGDYEVVHTAPDNVVAWHDRSDADIVAWIGLASGPVALAADPGIASVAALRGRRIAVDARQSGFVSILLRIFRDAGVGASEVELVPIGATELRFDALRERTVSATLLTLPWLLTARDEGFVLLTEQSKVMPRLQGSCGASLRGWLASHSDHADAYLRAVIASLTWMCLPASLAELRQLVRARFGIDERQADAVCAAFLDPLTGWPPSARIDPAGMEEVCALRQESDAPAQRAADAYYSLEPYARVLGSGMLGAPL